MVWISKDTWWGSKQETIICHVYCVLYVSALIYTVWCCCHALNFFQILISDTPYITKEGEIWHVFCEFKVWFKFCCYHCYLGCLYGLVALFIKVLFNPIVIKSVWVKKLSASPKCLTRDFTNLNRIYTALQTKVWWAMEVFLLCWLKSCSSAFTLVTICMIICSLACGKDKYHVFPVCSSRLCDTRCHPLRSVRVYHTIFTWQTAVLQGTVRISKHT